MSDAMASADLNLMEHLWEIFGVKVPKKIPTEGTYFGRILVESMLFKLQTWKLGSSGWPKHLLIDSSQQIHLAWCVSGEKVC